MVKMNLAEVQTQSSDIKSFCSSLKDGAENLNTVATTLGFDLGISGITGDSIRSYLSLMYPTLAQTMILHAENVEKANQAYVDGYTAKCGGQSLDSEVLEEQIASYNQSINNLRESKRNQEIWYRSQDAALKQAISFDYQNSISSFASSILSNEQERDKIQEKLDDLLDFDTTSPTYFSNAQESAALMNEGLQLLGGEPTTGKIGTGSWNGHGFNKPNSDWQQRVSENWQQRNAKIKAQKILDRFVELQEKSLRGNITTEELSEFNSLITQLNEYEKKALTDAIEKYYYESLQHPISWILGFEYNEEEDYYYTNKHSIQSIGGFADFYDKIGWILGMNIDEEVIYFDANGKEYRLELWKGSYGFGIAYGAEIGLYYKNPDGKELDTMLQNKIPGWYACVEEPDQIKMKNTIYDKNTGEELLQNDTRDYAEDGSHFWNLAIRTDDRYGTEGKHDLITKSELEITDAEVRNAMYSSLKKEKNISKVDMKGDLIIIVWAK